MIIAHDYHVEYDDNAKAYRVTGRFAAICPDCRRLLSGYDTRKRVVIGDDGKPAVFLLRRFRCRECGKLHLEIRDHQAGHPRRREDLPCRRFHDPALEKVTHPFCLYANQVGCYRDDAL